MSPVEALLVKLAELGAAIAVRAVKLKRVILPPPLVGPTHAYPELPETVTMEDWPASGISFYALHVCNKCGHYNEKRAAYTKPPCREKPDSVSVELA